MTDVSDPQSELAQAETSPVPPIELAPTPSASDRPWPAVYALLMTWLRPATAARHLTHVGLLKAFGIHVVSAVILFFAGTAMAALTDRHSPFELWREILKEISRDPSDFLMGFSILCGVIEGMAFLLALFVMSWGARDEKLRSSLYHAMRTVWLQSMQVAVATLLAVVFFICSMALLRWAEHSVTNYSDRPWFMRHLGEIWGYFNCVVCCWAFWGMLRAVGARPVTRPAGVPPVCQGCGYNLTGMAVEGLCPECGEPVAASIGPDARPGILWERRANLGWLSAWWKTSWRAIWFPRQAGREIQVYSPPAAHRCFLLLSMVAAGLTAIIASIFWLAGFFLSGHVSYGVSESDLRRLVDEFLWTIAPVWGISTGLSVLAITILFAGCVGLIRSLGVGRNLLPAAMRCASYLSGFLVLWAAANILPAFVLGLASDIKLFDYLAGVLRIRDEEVALIALLLFNLIWLVRYLRLLYEMLQGARYATR